MNGKFALAEALAHNARIAHEALAPRIPHAQPQHNDWSALVKAPQNEAGCPPRFRVVFTRYACRLLDFDNGAGGAKFLCDRLRYENIIQDDSPEHIDFQFRQVRVKTKKEQGTEILIEKLP